MFIRKNIKLIANYTIGTILFLWITLALYRQVQHQSHLQDAFAVIIKEWGTTQFFLLGFNILLMLLNWCIEAYKWQLLIAQVEAIPFLKSLKSIFAGLSVSILTPNRIGEYAGRILFLNNDNKLKGISANVVGSFALLIVASFFGLLGAVYYGIQNHFTWIIIAALIIGLIVLSCIWFLFFHLDKIADWLNQFTYLQKIKTYIDIVRNYNSAILKKIILLSACRYLVYSLQFVLLLYLFDVHINSVDAFFTVFLIYWSMAILPSIAIAELGIRSGTSVFFLKVYSMNTLGIISSSVVLWCINLIIPAILGSILILSIKILKEK